jgi:hypothetical protein
MSDGKLNTDWIHTAAQMTLFANANAPKGRRFNPSHFPSPFMRERPKRKESVDALKVFLRK